jgi:hypothetical protein
MQTGHTWQDVLVIVITTLPAVIAAASSLRNGRTLRNGSPDIARKNGSVKTAGKKTKRNVGHSEKPDWFKPPDLS